MYYCFCKVYNSMTQEAWYFGRWYKDKHYFDVPRMLMNKIKKIQGCRKEKPEYNSFEFYYGCIKINDCAVKDNDWYQALYKDFDKCNEWTKIDYSWERI